MVVVDGAQARRTSGSTCARRTWTSTSAPPMSSTVQQGSGCSSESGRRSEAMPPWQGGGGMIAEVHVDRSTYAMPPERFEAGTPPIAEVVGLGATLDYIGEMGLGLPRGLQQKLAAEALQQLSEVPGVRVLGADADRVRVISFVLDGIHPHDVGTILDAHGIAVRAGHHCCSR